MPLAPNELRDLLATLPAGFREVMERLAGEVEATESLEEILEDLKSFLASTPLDKVRVFERLLSQVRDVDGLEDLLHVAFTDAALWPDVRKVSDDGRDAYDRLWVAIRPRIVATIRGAIFKKGDQHVQEVERRVLSILWDDRKKYRPDEGFYLPWARMIARNQARWYREDARTVPDDGREEIYPEGPPSTCFAELLRIVEAEEPHQVVAFLYNRYLGWKPARVVAELWERPFEEMPERLVSDLIEAYPELERISGLFAGFGVEARKLGTRCLVEFCVDGKTPQASISQWSGQVAESLSRRVISSGAALLQLICELRVGSYERLAFLWCRLLREPALSLYALAEQLLSAILAEFRSKYRTMSDLTVNQIVFSTRPLERQIMPARRLKECSRGDLHADIAGWRDRVQAILLGLLGGAHLLSYAYLCGCLPGLVRRERQDPQDRGQSGKRKSDEDIREASVAG